MQPRVEIIGIHSVRLTKSALVENERLECGDGNFYVDDLIDLSDEEFADRFADLYLIEMRLEAPDAGFDPGEFTQALPGVPRDSWQVAFDEKFLNDDGTEVLDRPPSSTGVRIGFFLHCVDVNEPLTTPFGTVSFPVPTRMPQRLEHLFRYVPP